MSGTLTDLIWLMKSESELRPRKSRQAEKSRASELRKINKYISRTLTGQANVRINPRNGYYLKLR